MDKVEEVTVRKELTRAEYVMYSSNGLDELELINWGFDPKLEITMIHNWENNSVILTQTRPVQLNTEPLDSRPETYAHILVVQSYLFFAMKELLSRACNHDASKLTDPELATFNEYTAKLKDSTYGSEEYKGFLEGMGEALKHHYANNRHHPEHFPTGIEGMNLIDLLEMICDWLAASQRHDDGSIRRSIHINQGRFGYSDELKNIFHNTVDFLLELHEDKTA